MAPRPKPSSDISSVTALFLIAMFLVPRPAFAYVDPGTGGVLVQIITGGVAGLVVLARMYWHRLKGLFFKSPDNAE